MPTEGSNIASVLDAPSTGAPDRVALIVDDEPCTYAGLAAEVAAWATTLAEAGVGTGDRVALADWGGVRSTAVTLAAMHLGAAAAQMNPLLTGRELSTLARVSDCGGVGVADEAAGAPLGEALGTSARVLLAPEPQGDLPVRADGGERDALVLFTSGTTGVPKPVPVTHAAIAARVGAYRAPFDAARAPTVSLMCVPSFHVGGMLGLLLALYSGDTTVVLPRFDAGRWLEQVERHRVVAAFVVPTMLRRILDHPDVGAADTSSLRSISYGAAAAPVDLVERAMAQWPDAGFANVFGQTETLGAYTSLTPADHRDPRRIGSVGRPLPGVEVRIVDPDTGRDAGADVIGELWVRTGQTVVEGRADGWFVTGDLGRLDSDGYLYPAGRGSDLISRGGEKFGPNEVADALRDHPAIAELVVVGVPDDEMGMRVGVLAVSRAGTAIPDLAELRSWCRELIAPFKLPELLAVVDALPYNELGKITRSAALAELDSPTTERRSGGTPP